MTWPFPPWDVVQKYLKHPPKPIKPEIPKEPARW